MRFKVIQGDALEVLRNLPEQSAHCCVTSPPYWGLRDYGVAGQIGLEGTPEEYVARLVRIFREVRRVLRDDGTLWLNLGDSYAAHGSGAAGKELAYMGEKIQFREAKKPAAGLKPKDLVGIPWRVAFALQQDGWYLRSDIIWAKPNPMPESVTDRPTKAHEYIFLLAKSERYYYNREAILESLSTDPKENYLERAKIIGRGEQDYNGVGSRMGDRDKSGGFPPCYRGSSFQNGKTAHNKPNVGQGPRHEHAGRNKRTVWDIATEPFPEAHFATFPTALVKPCIKAGCPEGGTVLDPFSGSGTTGVVASRLGRNYIGIEINPEYVAMSYRRWEEDAPLVNVPEVPTPRGIEGPLFTEAANA